jgi:hypothetical protein
MNIGRLTPVVAKVVVADGLGAAAYASWTRFSSEIGRQ